MKTKKIIESNVEPSKEALWLDNGKLKSFENGKWVSISGGSSSKEVKLWGQSFDGSNDVNGDITINNITLSDKLGLEYVDLGLPSGTLWSKCNLGATEETGVGLYYQWGSTVGYSKDEAANYSSWATCPGNSGSSSADEAALAAWDAEHASGMVLSQEVDAVYQATDGEAHMPDYYEWKELLDNTTSTWTTIDGVAGTKRVSKIDDSKYIFFPAGGYFDNGSLENEGDYDVLWASTRDYDTCQNARGLMMQFAYQIDSANRYQGRNVRAVTTNPASTTKAKVCLPSERGTLALNKVATDSSNGLMSSADKSKLDSLEATPKVWVNIVSTSEDTKSLIIDGEIKPIEANISTIFENFKKIEFNINSANSFKRIQFHSIGLIPFTLAKFQYCKNLTELDTSCFDTSAITNMEKMFYYCSNISSLDVIGFDTSNVTRMDTMFNGCEKLTSLDLENWNTSKVTTMSSQFAGCSSLTFLDLSGWDLSKVTDFYGMFRDCSSLKEIKLGKMTAKSQRFQWLFSGCSSLTTLNIDSWDFTQNQSEISGMFQNCSSLTSLDLSNWMTVRCRFMNSIFEGCSSLTSLDISGWNTFNNRSADSMFKGCSALITLKLGPSFGDGYNYDITYDFSDLVNWTDDSVQTLLSIYDRKSAKYTNTVTLKLSTQTKNALGTSGINTLTSRGYTVS